ncbi:cytidylate kinase [Nitrosococcus halophilus Nc 4]|uniref:Cytidylate kinase n=1 Tax=Nitrosococcus halophilus (strain Nc4) TaxID=472759 RepID=D5BX29_NITHN|nr:(d)CMP kinase [Nitrosococcus halophilus]ADE15712.1 cytidylate kinase [Nitrosococcus halophilus Nc 4]
MGEDKGIPVITIDGPSGSGKGTLAQQLAQHLGWHYLDSGAIYRVLALAASKHGITKNDPKRLKTLAHDLDVRFVSELGETSARVYRVYLEDLDVSNAIRSEDCGNAASKIAALPEVREALLRRQRAFRKAPGLVTDGRDMGTVVFPEATLKIFLTASPQERARRRYKQLKEKGIDANLNRLEQEIAGRDVRDCERNAAPLKPADDAIILDSTKLAINDVFQQVLLWLPSKLRN